jgi:hypothetical protein
MFQLAFLRGVQVFCAGGEVTARVLHATVEPQGKEVVSHIVVVTIGGAISLSRMGLTAQAGWPAAYRAAWAGLRKSEDGSNQAHDIA